jgi:hypothetical protein
MLHHGHIACSFKEFWRDWTTLQQRRFLRAEDVLDRVDRVLDCLRYCIVTTKVGHSDPMVLEDSKEAAFSHRTAQYETEQ